MPLLFSLFLGAFDRARNPRRAALPGHQARVDTGAQVIEDGGGLRSAEPAGARVVVREDRVEVVAAARRPDHGLWPQDLAEQPGVGSDTPLVPGGCDQVVMNTAPAFLVTSSIIDAISPMLGTCSLVIVFSWWHLLA
jgi:hypothetical protein